MSHPAPRLEPLLRHAIGEHGASALPGEVGAWIDFAAAHRVIPLLFDLTCSSLETSERTDDGQAITAAQIDVMSAMVRYEHDLLEVAAAFEIADIPFAVLKGFATAHLDYPDPSLRQAADVDLLVSPGDLVRAIGQLGDLGWKQAYALPRHHLEFTHAVTLRNAKRIEVDLHQRIAHRALGRAVPTDQLLASRRPYQVAGRELWALGDADRVVHAAIHEATSRGHYHHGSSAADVLVLTDRHRAGASDVAERAAGWGVDRLVMTGVEAAWAAARLPVPIEWQRSFAALHGRRRRHLIDLAYLGRTRRPFIEEVAHLAAIPGWTARRNYLAGYLATDHDYSDQTGRTGLRAQLRYLWSRLRSREPAGGE